MKINKPKIKINSEFKFGDILEDEFCNFEINENPLRKVVISNTTIDSCIFKNIVFEECDFTRIDLIDTRFENCDLSNVSFLAGGLHRVEFVNVLFGNFCSFIKMQKNISVAEALTCHIVCTVLTHSYTVASAVNCEGDI